MISFTVCQFNLGSLYGSELSFSFTSLCTNHCNTVLILCFQLLLDVTVRQAAFSDMFKYLKQFPLSSSSILKKTYPTGNLTLYSDILTESIYCTVPQSLLSRCFVLQRVRNGGAEAESHRFLCILGHQLDSNRFSRFVC